MTIDPRALDSLRWRSAGPHRGGRVVAVAGHPTVASTFYFGACAGGVWKTTDGGAYWGNVSDGFFGTAAVGAIAVSESDPNVDLRGHRRGVHPRQRLARRRRLPLRRRRPHLAEPRPGRHAPHRPRARPPDAMPTPSTSRRSATPGAPTASAACSAPGTAAPRGTTCCSRASARARSTCRMDPHNPRVLYAAMWQAQPDAVGLTSGGPDSGLCKSDRRRRHLDRHQPQPRAAQGRARPDRRGGVRRRRPARLRGRRGRGRRAVPVRRRRRDLAAGQRGGGPPPPALVLHARDRRPERRRHGLDRRLLAAGNRSTAARPSARSPRPTATTTISGSTRATRGA